MFNEEEKKRPEIPHRIRKCHNNFQLFVLYWIRQLTEVLFLRSQSYNTKCVFSIHYSWLHAHITDIKITTASALFYYTKTTANWPINSQMSSSSPTSQHANCYWSNHAKLYKSQHYRILHFRNNANGGGDSYHFQGTKCCCDVSCIEPIK